MKKLITLVLTLALCVPMFLTNSVEAKAEDGDVQQSVRNEITWETILGAINNGQTSGKDGNNNTIWEFADSYITICENFIVTGTADVLISNRVVNYGTINGGTFEKRVYNSGIISSGMFKVLVESDGTINGGTFEGNVWNGPSINDNDTGTITNGYFYGTVNNHGGIIENGKFHGNVNVSTVRNFNGKIVNGLFYDTVNVKDNGRIDGGKFKNIVNNTGSDNNIGPNVIIDPTLVPNNGSQENNTPQPSPNPDENTNSNNGTSSSKKQEEVKPVVIVIPEGLKYADNVMEQLSVVPKDGKVIIDTKDWYCFNRTLAEKVTNMKNVTVTIKYKYQGKNYEVTIPAGSDVVSLLDENGFVGFRYLDAVFGGREL